jgi:dipeptidyl aminopeptidase/acylaminoacyl peptidase
VLSAQLLATQGYAVIYPSLPIQPGAESDIPAALAEHAVAAVDALAGEGVVDPARIGLIGHSFGGHSVASILAKRSDRFRAGVARAGMYDPVHGYGVQSFLEGVRLDGREQALSIPQTEAGQLQLNQPPWKALEPYVRNSPFFQVESINAPLLMLHGDLDRSIVDIAGADRMYSALVRAGKTTALVRYWGEGHLSASQASIRDEWARITAWFAHYLLAPAQASANATSTSPSPTVAR